MTIGPWIEDGFYYDFAMPTQFSESDLARIKVEMDQIIKSKLPISREEVTRDEARWVPSCSTSHTTNLLTYVMRRRRISALNEPYKMEILDSIKAEPITIYHIGDEWWDLCAGPHLSNTGELNAKSIQVHASNTSRQCL